MQIWVYGNSFESFLVGVAVPERKPLEDWAASNSITANFEELCMLPKARKYILDELNNTGRTQQVCRPFTFLKHIPVTNICSSDFNLCCQPFIFHKHEIFCEYFLMMF